MFYTKVVEKIKTNILCAINFSCRIWDNVEKYGRRRGAKMTSQYDAYELHDGEARQHVCTLMHTTTHPGTRTRARTYTRTHTHKHVMFTASPRQQLFRERALVLRYTYTACSVISFSRHNSLHTESKENFYSANTPSVNKISLIIKFNYETPRQKIIIKSSL
jgi:hypothetical protein